MARRDVYKAAAEILEGADVSYTISVGHKQVKIRWAIGDQGFLYCCAKTASDNRAFMNVRCDVRRILRSAGIPA